MPKSLIELREIVPERSRINDDHTRVKLVVKLSGTPTERWTTRFDNHRFHWKGLQVSRLGGTNEVSFESSPEDFRDEKFWQWLKGQIRDISEQAPGTQEEVTATKHQIIRDLVDVASPLLSK